MRAYPRLSVLVLVNCFSLAPSLFLVLLAHVTSFPYVLFRPLASCAVHVTQVFFDTHPASTCLAWELSDQPFADMTADGARSHASRRRDVLTAMAATGDNLHVGAAGSLPATTAPTTTASPPSSGSPAGDADTPVAGSSTSSPVASMAAFLSGSDTLLLPNVGIGQDSSDDEGG